MAGVKLIDVEQYLKDTIAAVDPSFQLTVSEVHRKGMMRALLGISKVKMDEDLRNLSAAIEWGKAEKFLREELNGFEPPQGAPQFQGGLEIYESFAPNAAKLFSYLARGRAYKGQMDLLLQDVRPDLSPIFHEVVGAVDEEHLLEAYALQQDPAQQELLLMCVKKELVLNSSDSSDCGKSKGAKGESSLKEFLSHEHSKERVLHNTFITTKHKNAMSKKCPYVIQLPKSFDVNGMTTELDAVVLAPFNDGDETMTIDWVWEAKATLHPVTLYDALSKKFSAISTIFAQANAKLYIKGEEYSIHATGLPRIGVFGSKILSPSAAARRSQLLTCEVMLSTSPEAVKEALDTGRITVSHEKLMADLNACLLLTQKVKPKVYVASLLD
ncbi:unnamed protein product [Cylindrotheca closterium]|uniref:Uncharacterized protein n=1 Tax=Cylindrotheca closterium TaxID=2856 RepID=A0AAD2FT86_9STRA|nr:unnamed protein product [Cylindrotheca closterium]